MGSRGPRDAPNRDETPRVPGIAPLLPFPPPSAPPRSRFLPRDYTQINLVLALNFIFLFFLTDPTFSFADTTAPLYSNKTSREGFAHWTTSHLPPRKRLGDGTRRFETNLPYGEFAEVPEVHVDPLDSPEKPERNPFWEQIFQHAQMRSPSPRKRKGKKGQISYKGFRPSFNFPKALGPKRVGRFLRQKVGQVGQLGRRLFRPPLHLLQFAAVLILNVTYSVTYNIGVETFGGLPGHVRQLAKWLWGASERKGEDPHEHLKSKLFPEGVPLSPGKIKQKMQDGLHGLGKNSRKLTGMVVGGMRRTCSGFQSQEFQNEQRRVDFFVKEGRRCNSMCDSAGAVENFRQAVAIRPSDPDLLVCLSKSLSDRVFTEDVFHNHPLARAISKEAAEVSERAIELNPKCSEAHLCLGAALGRLSMWSDNREKVELSGTIKERCEEAIRLDPTSDLALHVLGRYQHQMANLGRIVRALVRVMYGGKLEPGTLEEAEALFRRAVEIAPKRLIHRVELGKLLLDMQRKDEARDQLRLAMTLPREDINSEHERRDAAELLKKHWGEKVVIPTFTDPPPTPPPRLSSVSRRSSFDTSGRRSFDDVRENPFLTRAAQQAAAA